MGWGGCGARGRGGGGARGGLFKRSTLEKFDPKRICADRLKFRRDSIFSWGQKGPGPWIRSSFVRGISKALLLQAAERMCCREKVFLVSP